MVRISGKDLVRIFGTRTDPALPDADLVDRILRGQIDLFEVLMRRHNRGAYRAVRAVLRDESDVQDVLQQTYLKAYTRLSGFRHRSQFSTWLIRIALHEAFDRRRKAGSELATGATSGVDEAEPSIEAVTSAQPDPERQAYAEELRQMLERAVDALAEPYRIVFMMRDVEGLSTAETSEALGIGEEAVKTRLHRARSTIRRTVAEQIGAITAGAFDFPASRCDRVVRGVMAMIVEC